MSGRLYRDLVREAILARLGRSEIRWNDGTEIILHRARGYARNAKTLRDPSRPTLRKRDNQSAVRDYADGGLLSTVVDLAKLDAALYTEELLQRSSPEQMWTPARLSDGRSVEIAGKERFAAVKATPEVNMQKPLRREALFPMLLGIIYQVIGTHVPREESQPVTVWCQPNEVVRAHLLDIAVVVTAVSRPDEVLLGAGLGCTALYFSRPLLRQRLPLRREEVRVAGRKLSGENLPVPPVHPQSSLG